jgi:hypothetical protein
MTEEILHRFIAGGDDDAVKKLVSSLCIARNGRCGRAVIERLFAASIDRGRLKLVEYFKSLGARDYDNAFYHAIKGGIQNRKFFFRMVDVAIREGATLDKTIYAAAEGGDEDIVTYLIDRAKFRPKAFMYGSAKGGNLKLLRASFIVSRGQTKQEHVNMAFLHALEGFVVHKGTPRDHPRVLTYLLRGITNFEEAIEMCKTLEFEGMEDIIRSYIKKGRAQTPPEEMEKDT